MYLIVGASQQSEWRAILALFEGVGCSIADQQQFEEWCIAAFENKCPESGEVASFSRLDEGLRNSAGELLNKMLSPRIFPVYDSRYLPVLQHWLNEFPGGCMLLFYSRPEPALAEAMEQHKDPDMVLHQWREMAEKFMHAYHHNINKALLIDAQAVISEPESLFRACEERFGLSFNFNNLNQAEKTSSREIHKLFASQFVRQSPGLTELLDELYSNSLLTGATDKAPTASYAEAYKDFERIRIQHIENRLKNLERENELLILQLHQAQERLESYCLEGHDHEEVMRLKQSISWRVTAPMRVLAAFCRRILRKTGVRKIINRIVLLIR